MAEAAASPVARALGRIPSGLFVVTTSRDEVPIGFLGSLVMQMGFAPPTVAVAVGRERPHLSDMRRTGRFALSILDPQCRGLMTPFVRKLPPGASPFDGLQLLKSAAGTPVLGAALAWLDCEIVGEYATGDHIVVFGEVTEAALLREGEPSTHVRKNGFDY